MSIGVVSNEEAPERAILSEASNPVNRLDPTGTRKTDYTRNCAFIVNLPLNTGRCFPRSDRNLLTRLDGSQIKYQLNSPQGQKSGIGVAAASPVPPRRDIRRGKGNQYPSRWFR